MNRWTKLALALLIGVSGALVLFLSTASLLWRQSVLAEEERVSAYSQVLGQRAEQIVIEAVAIMDRLNQLESDRCGSEHMAAMNSAVIGQAHIKALGYSRADQRICGVGFVQEMNIRPPQADKIYPSGVIAWWPSEHTQVGDVQLFMLRFGEHDIAIDPNLLLVGEVAQERNATIWVENLQMAGTTNSFDLPEPTELFVGLTVDRENNLVVSRTSLGSVLAIDVVVAEPIGVFWARYQTILVQIALFALVLGLIWAFLIMRYARNQVSLGAELAELLAKRRLAAVYQPIIDLKTGNCVGAEALARWNRRGGETIGPNVFVPMATEAGLLSEIKFSILSRTLEDLGPQLRQENPLRISVNITSEDLYSDSLEDDIGHILSNKNVPSSAISLEITESAFVESGRALEKIQQLRRSGHKIYIDDFGTGYSSLSHLENLELDVLKIDKSFVDTIESEGTANKVIVHIIEMAQSLNLDIVAEGIEHQYQADWLSSMGVQYGQGFLYSRPLDRDDFLKFIRERET